MCFEKLLETGEYDYDNVIMWKPCRLILTIIKLSSPHLNDFRFMEILTLSQTQQNSILSVILARTFLSTGSISPPCPSVLAVAVAVSAFEMFHHRMGFQFKIYEL